MGSQVIQHGAVALGEVACSRAAEEENLRVRERSVQPDGHLAFDAPRVKPAPVDIRSAELGPGEEIGDLQGVELTGCLVVAANRMLVPDVPVGRLLRPIGLAWENLLPQNGLPDAVELVKGDFIAGY